MQSRGAILGNQKGRERGPDSQMHLNTVECTKQIVHVTYACSEMSQQFCLITFESGWQA